MGALDCERNGTYAAVLFSSEYAEPVEIAGLLGGGARHGAIVSVKSFSLRGLPINNNYSYICIIHGCENQDAQKVHICRKREGDLKKSKYRIVTDISLSSSSLSKSSPPSPRRILAGVLCGTGGGSVMERKESNPPTPNPISVSAPPPKESPSDPQAAHCKIIVD